MTNTAHPCRTIAYTRVSTDEQGDHGAGLDAQRATIEADLTRRGWGPACLVTDVASGKSLNGRRNLADALDRLDRGEADHLVVAKLDRLARSVLDFASILARAQRHGWALVCLDVNVDTSSPSGELMATVVAAFAQYERALIAQRTREALAVRKSQGVRLGRPVTLAAETRARIADERAQGRSLPTIANMLNTEQVPTARGGRWHPATVAKVLRSLELDAQAVA